jgi:hypothetical protein
MLGNDEDLRLTGCMLAVKVQIVPFQKQEAR